MKSSEACAVVVLQFVDGHEERLHLKRDVTDPSGHTGVVARAWIEIPLGLSSPLVMAGEDISDVHAHIHPPKETAALMSEVRR